MDTLFHAIEQKFQLAGYASNRWYVLAITTLTASPHPDQAHQLYQYLINKPENASPESRKAIVRRLREALVKSTSIIGVCKPIDSILAIAKVEREEDRDYTSTRETWQNNDANHQRAMDWYAKLYARNAHDTLGLFDAHKDFAWISTEITYGLYLSDRAVLDDLDTQLVVLPGIMIQNLPLETHWHIRGTRRLGESKERVKVIWECVQLVAEFHGIKLDRVPGVEEVEYDV
ncbi:hypothetical protein BDW59DRAFT_153965 [Aspergillus cavernicola]|uniref:Isoprenoid synthase domain-containing protein n=1 Tax=Aspergillus cavernicola TaxID=176166 RepID=A0ABR4HIG7_9EURO